MRRRSALCALPLLAALALPAEADMYQDGSNAKQPDAARNLNMGEVNVRHWGAIGDGASHKLSERYATLAEAQANCPHAISLTADELDWCAADAAISRIPAAAGGSAGKGGIRLYFPGGNTNGYYRMSQPLRANDVSLWLDGDGKLQTKLVWTGATDGIEFGLALTGQGGALRLSNMTLAPASGDETHTAVHAHFVIANPTITIEHVNFGGINQLGFGHWRTPVDVTGVSSGSFSDIYAVGPSSPAMDAASAGFRVASNPTGGSFHHYFSRVFVINYMVGYKYDIPAGSTSGIQGVYFNQTDATNGGDFLQINNLSSFTMPQWMITNSHWQGYGWFVNASGSTAAVGKLVAQGNFIQPGSLGGNTWPGGTPVPAAGGGFYLTSDDETIIEGNQISVVGTGQAAVRGVWAGGASTAGVYAHNTCQLPNVYAASVTMTCAYLDAGATGWTIGRNSLSPVNGNIARIVNNGTANSAHPILVAQNATPKVNTGNGTTTYNLASVLLPPLGPNDTIRINTLWTVGGTAANTKTPTINLSTSGCAVNTLCTGGGSLVQNLTMNTSALITANTNVLVRNTGVTNAQVSFNGTNAVGLGTIAGAPGATAIETKDAAYLNFGCATATSAADSCTLAGYSVEILPGM